MNINVRQRVASLAAALVIGAAGSVVLLAEPAAAAVPVCTSYVRTSIYRPSSSTGDYRCWMQRGHRTDGVIILQEAIRVCYGAWLRSIGFPQEVKSDGDFGPITEDALRRIQKLEGAAVDGVFGIDTSYRMLWFNGRDANCRHVY
ncbi:peptidoglycan-binding domain-containing protein [Dactylosporangium sp. NPDC049742]|uniref:peptidoglycan-binding domain-containing protein n=1 Tax=Dactylosporangium TaxID=35753 RepID=UPI0031CEF5AB